MKKILAAIILSGSIAFFTGCGGDSGSSNENEDNFKSCTVTFVDESGNTLATEKAEGYGEGRCFLYTKTGYNAKYFDSDGKEITGDQYSTKKDCKITVKLSPISYTIKFEKSPDDYRTISGTFPEGISCVYDTEYTLPENTLSCTSYGTTYKARGWTNTKSKYNKSGEYKSGSKVKNLATKDGTSVTLYPCFSNEDSFTLEFYTSEGSYARSTSVYADSGETIPASSIPEATKTGYNHKGFYLSTDSSKKAVDFTTYTVSGNATFYPIFEVATYKATFTTEHGTAPTSVSWTYSDSYSEKTNISTGSYVLSETGYNFNGWFEEGSYSPTSYIYHTTAKDLSLKAKWSPWAATITYDANRPSTASNYGGRMLEDNFDYATPKNLRENKFYINGYKFKGWNTKKDGTGTAYADNDSFTWKGSANKEKITLYAQWEATQASINVGILAPSTNSDIKLEYDSTAKNFKATLNGAASFKWYVDGTVIENESGSTLSVYKLTSGQHSIMVTAELSGRTYGTTLVVDVTVNE